MSSRFTIALAFALGGFSGAATAAGMESQESLASTATAVADTAEASSAVSAEQDAGQAPAATAEMASSNAQPNDWDVAFTPYLWIAGIKGDIAIPRGDGDGIHISKSFADTLSNLNFAFMGALDVRHKRFVALTDIMYLSLTAKAKGFRDPQFIEGKAKSRSLMATAAIGYRLVDQGPLYFDLLAGGRLVALNVDLEVSGPRQTRRAGASPSKLSPLIGARFRAPIGKDWGLMLYGDVGGIFTSADVKWQLVGTVQHDLSRHWRMSAGYRHLKLRHDKQEMDFDVALSGPILGVTYRF